jgi:flavorubredoxin
LRIGSIDIIKTEDRLVCFNSSKWRYSSSEDLMDANEIKAIVVYSTRYGNTERIAKSLVLGLKEAGVICLSSNASEVEFNSLKACDLICVGGPTEAFSASKPMKQFLEKLELLDLRGKFGFAFDTKIDSRFSGSAAKTIEKKLDESGMRIVLPRESAIVEGNTKVANLKASEEKRFQEIGLRLGNATLAAKRGITATVPT